MSGNVNVGFVDGRMCSRILKPPGGGYSELFFTNEDASTVATPKKTPPVRTESTIESILRTDADNSTIETTPKRKTPVKTPEIAKILHEENDTKIIEETTAATTITTTETIEKKVEELKIDQTKSDESKTVKEEKNVVAETKTPEVVDSPGRRGRVPPGGFSTALW